MGRRKPSQKNLNKKGKPSKKGNTKANRRSSSRKNIAIWSIATIAIIAITAILWQVSNNRTSANQKLISSPLPPVRPGENAQLDPEVRQLIEQQIRIVQGNQASAKEHGTLAIIYEANELWPEAHRSYLNASSLDPKDWVWKIHAAAAQSAAGDFTGGLDSIRDVAEEFPTIPQIQHRLGRTLLETEDLDAAENAFQRTVNLEPNSCAGYIGLGQVAIHRRQFLKAAELLEQGVRLCPDYGLAHYLLGSAYRRIYRKEEARHELAQGVNSKSRFMGDRIMKAIPKYYRGLAVQLATAMQLLESGKPDKAVAILEKARIKRPRDTNVLNNLAIAYLNLRQPEKSRKALLEALEIDPTQFPTYINLVESCLSLRNPQEALTYSQKAIELAPTVGQAHYSKARALMALKRFQEARVALLQTVRLDTRNPEAFLNLAECCYQLGDREEALKYFTTAAERMPRNLNSQIGVCTISMELGLWNRAETALLRAKRIAPDHQRVRQLERSFAERTGQ